MNKRNKKLNMLVCLILVVATVVGLVSCNDDPIHSIKIDRGLNITVISGENEATVTSDTVDVDNLEQVLCSYLDKNMNAVIDTYACISLADLLDMIGVSTEGCTKYTFWSGSEYVTTQGIDDWYLAVGMLVKGKWVTLDQEQGAPCRTVNPKELNAAKTAVNRLCWLKAVDKIELVYSD